MAFIGIANYLITFVEQNADEFSEFLIKIVITRKTNCRIINFFSIFNEHAE